MGVTDECYVDETRAWLLSYNPGTFDKYIYYNLYFRFHNANLKIKS